MQNFLVLNLGGTFPSPTEAQVQNPYIFRSTSEYQLSLAQRDSVSVAVCRGVEFGLLLCRIGSHRQCATTPASPRACAISTDSGSLCHRPPLGYLPMQTIHGVRCCLEMHVIPLCFPVYTDDVRVVFYS